MPSRSAPSFSFLSRDSSEVTRADDSRRPQWTPSLRETPVRLRKAPEHLSLRPLPVPLSLSSRFSRPSVSLEGVDDASVWLPFSLSLSLFFFFFIGLFTVDAFGAFEMRVFVFFFFFYFFLTIGDRFALDVLALCLRNIIWLNRTSRESRCSRYFFKLNF
jgi:hypothetical protein